MDNLDIKLNLDFLWELTNNERSRLEKILNSRIGKFREDIGVERIRSKWVCSVCDKSTWDTEYDYLLSPTMHLGCAIESSTDENLKQIAEKNKEIFHYDQQ